jgi:large subunit ribosomal protein L22
MSQYKYASTISGEYTAKAVGISLSVSPKQCIEICKFIRGRKLQLAKSILNSVINKRAVVPFTRFNRDMGHKTKMCPGRFPVKASSEILKVLLLAESNAQDKGLNADNLTIVHICAQRGPGQLHYGRKRSRKMKRTNIEVILEEKVEESKKEKSKEQQKKEENVTQLKKPEGIQKKSAQKTEKKVVKK